MGSPIRSGLENNWLYSKNRADATVILYVTSWNLNEEILIWEIIGQYERTGFSWESDYKKPYSFFPVISVDYKNASAACPQKAPSECTRLSCSSILAPPPTSSVFVLADRPFQVIVAKAEQGKQTSIWRKTYICPFTEQTHTWFWFEELLKVSHLSLIRRIMFPWRAAPFLLISLGVWGKNKKATISLESQRYHFISSLTHPYTTPSFEGHS